VHFPLNCFTFCRASLIDLSSKAETLLQDPSVWPSVTPLLRFSLPLLRLTTQMLITKRWIQRNFILNGSRLCYADGKNGYPDSREGTLAFSLSNPSPDGRYCTDLSGDIFINFTRMNQTLFAGCTVRCCDVSIQNQSFAFEIKFPLRGNERQVDSHVYLFMTFIRVTSCSGSYTSFLGCI
jgi:hypothetical protein